MNKIQYHYNEFFLLRDFSDEAEFNFESAINYSEVYYTKLKACIAAKTKIDNPELLPVVKMETQKGYSYLDGKGVMPLTDGSIFDLPDNVQFEERCKIHNNKACEMCTEKVIHLKLKQEVKTELKCASEMGVGYAPIIGRDESQDELWSKVINATDDVMRSPQEFERCRQYLKSKFKIQRIHPEQYRYENIY